MGRKTNKKIKDADTATGYITCASNLIKEQSDRIIELQKLIDGKNELIALLEERAGLLENVNNKLKNELDRLNAIQRKM